MRVNLKKEQIADPIFVERNLCHNAVGRRHVEIPKQISSLLLLINKLLTCKCILFMLLYLKRLNEICIFIPWQVILMYLIK